MQGWLPPTPGRLAGREADLALLGSALDEAEAGRGTTVLVSGAPGVGKTALVAQALRSRSPPTLVLSGTCLPMATVPVPFLPLRTAFARADGAEELRRLVDAGPTHRIPVQLDDWLGRLARTRPVTLWVDDLQWADPGTLDVLTYVLAGPRDRALGVVVTMRRSLEDHHVEAWLADAVRIPGVTRMEVCPLDREGTAEQVATLLGAPGRDSLVEDVHRRGRGNPYFTRLLVEGLSPDSALLPDGVPRHLTEAVLRPWHRLAPAARSLTQLLAVSGVPQSVPVIEAVCREVGLHGEILPLVREAVAADVLVPRRSGRYWFTHPLQAMALLDTLLPEERRRGHAAFAAVLEDRLAAGEGRLVDDTVAVADHHFLAGAAGPAYTWALRAADMAGTGTGAPAAGPLRLLRRAADLHPGRPGTVPSRRDLLLRARQVAEAAGEQTEELAVLDELVADATADTGDDPLLLPELLVRRTDLRAMTGGDLADVATLRHAVGLAEARPGSAVHARALAQLARAELWLGLPEGPRHARRAAGLARRCGQDRALAYALTAVLTAAGTTGAGAGAVALGEESAAAALRARDDLAYVDAVVVTALSLEVAASPVHADLVRRHREVLGAAGGAMPYLSRLAATEAFSLLLLGRPEECADRLREALGARCGPGGEASARLTAAWLAALAGRTEDARSQLHRAEEIVAGNEAFRAFHVHAVRAQVALAAGDPAGAAAAALAGARLPGSRPAAADRLLPLAARALADQARAGRDRRADTDVVESTVLAVRAEFPTVLPAGPPTPFYRRQVAALQLLYDAETSRALDEPGQAGTWATAALACAASSCPWEAAYAAWRTAEAFLAHQSARRDAEHWLRTAHEQATALGGEPVLVEVRRLAALARVPLGPVPAAVAGADGLPGLTARERDVLRLLVTGRTYAQIARELFVGEKTVSTHVSHLLRKTGTSGRVELARLAQRRAESGGAGHDL